jgi:ribosome-associated heat shock protein Hsp15
MGDQPLEAVRLDIWLDVACLFPTRSQAQNACKAGKVDVAGQRAKPHRLIRPGEEIVISRTHGLRQVVRVVALAEHHIPKAEARLLYEDRTPEPTPEQKELLELARLARVRHDPRQDAAPDRRERRELRRLKGMED